VVLVRIGVNCARLFACLLILGWNNIYLFKKKETISFYSSGALTLRLPDVSAAEE
jgi:hypothetical protein